MIKKALLKNTVKEITNNFKRFISILLIVLLGVGFFVGIKAASPDMKLTIDKYFDEQNVFDIYAISPLGFSKQNIEELLNVEGVAQVEGAYSTDVFVKVIKIESIPKNINTPVLLEGKLPENIDECIVENSFLVDNNLNLGDSITIEAGNIQDAMGNSQKLLKKANVKIVGIVDSPLYLSRDRGTTKLGSGKINYYMYIPLENFNTNIYTLAYITVKDAKSLKTYEDDYENLVENVKDAIEEKKPEWYILDRNQNAGYVSYLQDTDRIANIAKVFPVVFFVVAALISLTSMNRMVEEQRVEIGTLKALGYNKRQIASKYVIYAILATIIGGSIGMAIGFPLLPRIIFKLYTMMYTLPFIVVEFNLKYAIIGLAVATACTVGATVYSCIKSLLSMPAKLMRPKAPKAGKRVILEKIPFIWSHLNFTRKVTARNLFRYKKRFLMTIIGVAGCIALIIAGFGLRDAISSMIPCQYGEIFKYQLQVSLKNNLSEKEINNCYEKVVSNTGVKSAIKINMQSTKILKDDNNQSIQLIVPQENLDDYITLRNRKKPEEKYLLDDKGIIISEKLASLLNIKVGDTITIENEENEKVDVLVSGITENYISHYIYMSKELYKNLYKKEAVPNVILAITENASQDEEDLLGKSILENMSETVSSVTFNSKVTDIFNDVMNNLSLVVWILIIAAGLLALVVLYNLSNANITERIRELATIKVLGFYDKEVFEYVAKEMVILTVLGILVGMVAGNFLTTFIIKTCELDMLMFNPSIKVSSYIYGIIITLVFAGIVNIGTYFSLKKINMIESLKSVE